MEVINITSPREIKNILNSYGMSPHKKWGQNFLADGNIVNKILGEVGLESDDYIIEIGPGLGALTLPIAQKGVSLSAFEIDRGFVSFLKELLLSYGNAKIIEGDIRKVNLEDYVKELSIEKKIKIVANLPYYITSPLIYDLVSSHQFWNKAVLMVQREMAQRITAKVGSSLYGTLSVLCQAFTDIRNAFPVSPNVFYPPPRVHSSVIVMEPADNIYTVAGKSYFSKLVSGLFLHRRKTVQNSLCRLFEKEKVFMEKILKESSISGGERPESLSPAQFAKLSDLLYNYGIGH